MLHRRIQSGKYEPNVAMVLAKIEFEAPDLGRASFCLPDLNGDYWFMTNYWCLVSSIYRTSSNIHSCHWKMACTKTRRLRSEWIQFIFNWQFGSWSRCAWVTRSLSKWRKTERERNCCIFYSGYLELIIDNICNWHSEKESSSWSDNWKQI